MKRLAIIPARGGSKRIPRKNIKTFCGRPIIEYSIEAALQSGMFEEVMVSTDDPEIAEIAKNAGATVPFFRSEKNADDFSNVGDVVKETLEAYEKEGVYWNFFACIYATAPFVTGDRLKEGFEKMAEDLDAAFAVLRFSYPIQRALKRDEQGNVEMNTPEHLLTRSQDLAPMFHDAGLFYWVRTNSFLSHRANTFLLPKTAGIELNEWEAQDIDTPQDWEMAELKYRLLIEKGGLLSK